MDARYFWPISSDTFAKSTAYYEPLQLVRFNLPVLVMLRGWHGEQNFKVWQKWMCMKQSGKVYFDLLNIILFLSLPSSYFQSEHVVLWVFSVVPYSISFKILPLAHFWDISITWLHLFENVALQAIIGFFFTLWVNGIGLLFVIWKCHVSVMEIDSEMTQLVFMTLTKIRLGQM